MTAQPPSIAAHTNKRSGPPPTVTISTRTVRRRYVPPRWLGFTAKKLGHLLIVLVAVTFLVSLMLDFLPGDPARAILGEDASPDQVAQLRSELRLDDPVLVRYLDWVMSALQGDLGTSYRTGQPVGEAILQRLPVSVELMLLVQIIALVTAVVLAVWAVYRPNGIVDRIGTAWSFAAISAPHFVVGLFLVFVFAVTLGWLPASGFVPLTDGLGPNLATMILPALALSLEPAGIYQRLLRGDMQATMKEDFVLAAQAKGMSTMNILFRQVFRPSSFSLVTLAGINTARLIGSAVVIETLFALPGVGRLLVDSINARDFIMIQAIVAVIAVFYVFVNILIDLLYLLLDPRVRADRG
ncbi:ABC transporter permease [Microbacterium sp. zg-Y818]|uniref:ABC transporter permease n=1 Tax=unclassified Microbacterium TaxID=2609290 RepID=UPI00214B8849|nr:MULTISPECIES: ABC transporter permease [unclassified Microbacterium]MCR2799320.1 ABC transporter permease [Microbacterium sp. zg.Y818]WIM21321.1 ABC transporter permease [Microbacterium sp. zg-Y818]